MLDLLPQRLVNTGAQIIGPVHDGIILEIPEGAERDVAVIPKKTMIETGQVYLVKLRLKWRLQLVRHGQKSGEIFRLSDDGSFYKSLFRDLRYKKSVLDMDIFSIENHRVVCGIFPGYNQAGPS